MTATAALPLTIESLFDPALLAVMLGEGYVRVQVHPTLPHLAIYNYSEKAAYDSVWNPVTLACRGLIVDTRTGTVLARPFRKFFNHGQTGAATIGLDAPVCVLDKLDGCFPRQTALNLWGGGTITIGEVVRKRLPVTLVGMNEEGDLVPALVTDWHDNGRKDHWLDIEVDAPVSRSSGAGGHPNRLRVTINHHVYVNGEYRPACEIRPGDSLLTQTWKPSVEVINLVRASLLGDGCLVSSGTKPEQARYQEPHSLKQADYVHALRKALGDCAATRSNTISGYGSSMMWAGSREYAVLGDLRREWYPDGVKRVPADLSWLNDFVVAKWLMDDGARQQFRKQADRICFSTHSFPREDIVRLGDRLAEMYDITYHLVNDAGKGLALVINSGRRQQITATWEAVAPHVHPSMRYKLPTAYRDVPYVEMTPGRELMVSRTTAVVSVAPVERTKRNFPHGRTGYDITTTTHNYLARGVLVHNSLGILYPTGDGQFAVATRGSFASDQAVHATEVWRERYAARFTPPPGLTVLAEIVYPQNRIVVDYGDTDDLVLLGAVETATGAVLDPSWVPHWPGPCASAIAAESFAAALALPPRPNAEGLVVRCLHTGAMLKLKQEDYVRLHRIVTGLTARTVWEYLLTGGPLDDLIAPLPDEFHAWVRGVAAGIASGVAAEAERLDAEFRALVAQMPDGWTPSDRAGRKDFAAVAVPHPDKWAMFLLLDGRDLRPELLKRARPEPYVTPSGRTFNEDNA